MEQLKEYWQLISIHAPARGATQNRKGHGKQIVDFNPRSREGSDDIALQSVHKLIVNFNPRSREGSDLEIS